mgnify:CR=1 FL=1
MGKKSDELRRSFLVQEIVFQRRYVLLLEGRVFLYGMAVPESLGYGGRLKNEYCVVVIS